MDDMYNNDTVNENVNQATENAYQQSASDPYQKSVQEQLQYQYREPETDLEEPISMGEWLVTIDADSLCEYCINVCVGLQQQGKEEQVQLF